jgi:hypothetical protein
MWLHHGQRRVEAFDVDVAETGVFDGARGFAGGMAAAGEAPPNRRDPFLDPAQPRPGLRGNVLDEQEFPAGFQNARDLAQHARLVGDTAQDQCGDYGVYARIGRRQLFGAAASKIDVETQVAGRFDEIGMHETVRLDSDPGNRRAIQISEIGARSRTDFQNQPRESAKQPRFVRRHVGFKAARAAGKDPSEKTLSKSTRAAEEGFARGCGVNLPILHLPRAGVQWSRKWHTIYR